MLLDKIKRIISKILQHKRIAVLPLISVFFSTINIISSLSNPVCFSSLPELIANDVSFSKTTNGLVCFEYINKHVGSNHTFSGRYYLNKASSTNKSGKTFVAFYDNEVKVETNNNNFTLKIDNSIGMTDSSNYNALNLFLTEGTFPIIKHDLPTQEKNCVISKTLATKMSLSMGGIVERDLIGQTITNCGTELTIAGIVDDNCFVNKQIEKCGNSFVAFDFSFITSNDIDYSLYVFLKSSNYYDNYSTFQWLFRWFYVNIDDQYLDLKIKDNYWIKQDIDKYYSLQKNNSSNSFNIFYILAAVSYIVGFLLSILFSKKLAYHSKKDFFQLFGAISFYLIGFYFFGTIFNHKLINGFHTNTFSSYSCLFSLGYLVFLLIGFVTFQAFSPLIHSNSKITYREIKI